MISETDAAWVVAAVSGWDDTVDMSPFCLDHAQCTEYLVKAVVYHVHPLEGPVNLRCGHYITYFKHGHRWHLANDSQVDLVLMAGLRGLPYIVVMERINALEEDVVAIHDEGEPTEIPVEIPAASDSASGPGTESNAEIQLQADRKRQRRQLQAPAGTYGKGAQRKDLRRHLMLAQLVNTSANT